MVHGAPQAEEVRALMEHTDRVAEIQHTLRTGLAVTQAPAELLAPTRRVELSPP